MRELSNTRFGRLLVVEYAGKDSKKRSCWNCVCDCGNKVTVTSYSLLGGTTKSCGCLRKEMMHNRMFKNLCGRCFENLLVVECAGKTPAGKYLWKCRCVCGTVVDVTASDLLSGKKRSCGCLRKNQNIKITVDDLSGKRFGKLVVIEQWGRNSSGQVMWKCRCDCGSITRSVGRKLIAGYADNCGCVRVEKDRILGPDRIKIQKEDALKQRDKKRRYLENEYDTLWTQDMEKSIREFSPFCAVCGMADGDHLDKHGRHLHVDHVLPLSKGNGLYPGNAVLLCVSCNSFKWNRDLDELPDLIKECIVQKALEFKNYWEIGNVND